MTGEEVDFESDEVVVAETDDETGIVFRVPPDLVRVIATADVTRLYGLVPEWSQLRDFADPDPDQLRAFVDDLQRLARIAERAGGSMYSHGCA